jgi:putative oxidoreductase
MGSVAEEEMKTTHNSESIREQSAQRPTLNVEVSAEGTTSNIKHRTANIIWRIVDFVLAGIFVFAGLAKILNLDHLLADLGHFRFGDALVDLRQLSSADPGEFANGIDNYKLLPWPVSVALAFYLPWLEIFCALGLVFRLLYRGALSILTALILVFTLATIAAKVRGLDITCGCFGHASQNWSFPAHLATNLAILAGLLALWFQSSSKSL